MPLLDIEPGQNPEAEGELTFGTQSNPRAVVIGTDGAIEIAGTDYSFTEYAAATLGTNVTASGSPFATPGSRGEPGSTVRLRGRIQWTGNPTSGTALITLDERDRPTGTVVLPGVRTGPSGNVSAVAIINSDGELSLSAAAGTDGYLGLDGITFDRNVE